MDTSEIDETQGQCPVCKGHNLHYESSEFQDDMVFFPWTCADCKNTGTEWYSMRFIEQQLDEPFVDYLIEEEK